MLLKDLSTEELHDAGAALGVTPRLARRIQSLVFKGRAKVLPPELSQVSRRLWSQIRDEARVPHLETVEKAVSPTDGFAKYLFRGDSPEVFEAVRIPLLHRPGAEKYVVCVSSQVGCSAKCAFCATGRMGFKRNLATWEIVDQVLKVQEDSDYQVRGVVFMGMGEPLLNYRNVMRAARILQDPCGLAIDAKSITISTVGIVPMMRRFTEERRPYRLILSLHAATDELRSKLLPMNETYKLEAVMAAMRDYQEAMGRRIMLAWTMMAGINMDRAQMQALAKLSEGLKILLDLIPVNDASGQFRAPTREELSTFLDIIRAEVNCPVNCRYSGGKDVHGACGMLAGRKSGGEVEEALSSITPSL